LKQGKSLVLAVVLLLAPVALAQTGRGRPARDPTFGFTVSFCFCTGMALFIALLMRWQLASMPPFRGSPGPSTLQLRDEEVQPLEEQLKQVEASLVQVEDALRMRSDSDLRVLLNAAKSAADNARQSLESARKGIDPRSAVKRRIDKAHEAARVAMARAYPSGE
jgi:hypothetical protein